MVVMAIVFTYVVYNDYKNVNIITNDGVTLQRFTLKTNRDINVEIKLNRLLEEYNKLNSSTVQGQNLKEFQLQFHSKDAARHDDGEKKKSNGSFLSRLTEGLLKWRDTKDHNNLVEIS